MSKAPHPRGNSAPHPPTRSEAALGTLVVRLMDPSTTFAERDKLVAALTGKPVAAPVAVERVEQTAGGYELSDEMRQGRTLIGQVEGTKLKVAVRFAAVRNGEIDGTSPGLSIRVRGQVAGWDALFDRLIIDAS
ncbi:hypothetical protein PLCT1_01320 [Planctomycetaceae bacterium]|nr:hypothetical protein PLCT1_01320 [Planctomycetaceae bacterium]